MNKKTLKTTIVLLIVAIVSVSGCFDKDRNNPYDPKADNFEPPPYKGWKINSWSAPTPVITNLVHTSGADYRNGFPLKMVIAGNDKIHLVFYKVSTTLAWLYTTKEPGSDSFNQTYDTVCTSIYPIAGPEIALVSNDIPLIAYGNRYGLSTYRVCYQERISSWSSQDVLYTPASTISNIYIFLLTSDSLKARIFYVSNHNIYQSLRTGTGTIDPATPAEFITGIGKSTAIKYGTDDIIFLYTDSANTKLMYRAYKDSTVHDIWSTTETNIVITSISAVLDSSNNLHVCFGTYNSSADTDQSYYKLTYITNADGDWVVKGSIDGNSTSGPMATYAPALAVVNDKYDQDHIFVAYTLYEPPLNTYIWYAYFDENTWNVASQTLDAAHMGIMPSMVADSSGNLHIVYSWYASELDRTTMYIKGTPEEAQK